jgi:hypothetical protein
VTVAPTNVDLKVDTVMATVDRTVVMLVNVEAAVLTTERLLKTESLYSMIIAVGDEHVAIAIEGECSWKGQL